MDRPILKFEYVIIQMKATEPSFHVLSSVLFVTISQNEF